MPIRVGDSWKTIEMRRVVLPGTRRCRHQVEVGEADAVSQPGRFSGRERIQLSCSGQGRRQEGCLPHDTRPEQGNSRETDGRKPVWRTLPEVAPGGRREACAPRRDGPQFDRRRSPFCCHRCENRPTLANEMKRRAARCGLISICGAGGTAIAMILERD